MAIKTATPDQVASCVLALKAHIDRVEAENARLRTERDQARAWAAAWKQAAKFYRKVFRYRRDAMCALMGILDRKDAEIKRLREALEYIASQEKSYCLPDVMHSMWARAAAALQGPADG